MGKQLAVGLAMLSVFFIALSPGFAQFTEIPTGIQPVELSALDWGDYDNDGDLDLALAGRYHDGTTRQYLSRIYRNDAGSFVDSGIPLAGLAMSALAWGDYDSDGYLDLVITGYRFDSGEIYESHIYHSNGDGTFTDIGAPIAAVRYGAVAWGDYDHDGDLDLALCGECETYGTETTKVYRNDDGQFVDSGAVLAGAHWAELAWGDYDGDSDLDLIVAGSYYTDPPSIGYRCKLYENDGGTFTEASAVFPGITGAGLAWGDYDNDGDLDLALAGYATGGRISRIYRNNGDRTFSNISAGLTAVDTASLAWGDYDNDGDLDLALAGSYWTDYDTNVCNVYRNDGAAGFTNIAASLTPMKRVELAWGDCDNDGDLDLAVTGTNNSYTAAAKIFRNDSGVLNTLPQAPAGLSAARSGENILFSWQAGSDAQTHASGLSYNLRVGTSPGSDDVFCGMADLSTGYRRVAVLGNAQTGLSWKLSDMPGVPLYWSVQSVDTAFAGSAWAQESTHTPTISDIKALPDDETVTLSSVIATTDPDYIIGWTKFYVEEEDRSCGIQVRLSDHGLASGMRVNVTGVLDTLYSGERYIAATSVEQVGTGSIEPVGMTTLALGGADWAYNPETGAGQQGVEGGVGLNNIGLLVKVWGTVTYQALSAAFFCIDDGSGLLNPYMGSGIRVMGVIPGLTDPADDPIGWKLEVTGISSMDTQGGPPFRQIVATDVQRVFEPE